MNNDTYKNLALKCLVSMQAYYLAIYFLILTLINNLDISNMSQFALITD